MSSFPVVDVSIDTLLTTTPSVRKRLGLTRPEWMAASPFVVADRFKDAPIRSHQLQKASDSPVYLAEYMGQVPADVVRFVHRSRGLGTTWTGLTTTAEDEIRAVIDLPANVYHAATTPTAYYTGTHVSRRGPHSHRGGAALRPPVAPIHLCTNAIRWLTRAQPGTTRAAL